MGVAGCSHRGAVPPPANQITVYYSKAGSDTLAAFHYSAAPGLTGAPRAQYAVEQLLAGPLDPAADLLTFPPDTRAKVTLHDATAVVDLTGSITKRFSLGGGDEAGLFKSLTYTVTDVPGITAVQIRLNGAVAPSLPGGQLELDEPLTRSTFAQ